jgi:pimeloyl-ACP methyl ester carboxylesterase
MWAQENGWAVIAPQFRGVNDDPEAIGSDLAVQDVADAIDYATAQDGVDARRVFAVGYSGGGMMALLMAGRHPDKVAAVAAWGPPYDLVDFYRESRRAGRHYYWDLWRGCGGNPLEEDEAREECLRRSPASYLDTARRHEVAVFIGTGIRDSLLSPSHGARAFNDLADPADRLSDEQVEEIGRGRIPGDIDEPLASETFFGEHDPEPVFARQSAAVWIVFFRSDHDMAYQATLRWFATDPGR